jgi:hypothetical protein
MAGGVFSGAKLNGMTIRESANDGSDFTNPDADYRRLFLGEDGLLHVKDSSGTVTDIGAGSGNVATDTIWNAAGDLAVGSGSDTAARLPLAQGQLARVGGVLAYDSGTAFPGSPSTGDRYFRTNVGGGLEFMYDGTRWVTAQLFAMHAPALASPISVTGVTTTHMSAWGVAGPFSDLWLVEVIWMTNVDPTNTGAAYWNLDLYKRRTGGAADTSVASGTTQSLTASQNNMVRTAIGALAGSTCAGFYGFATKVSTPSPLHAPFTLAYRGVAT